MGFSLNQLIPFTTLLRWVPLTVLWQVSKILYMVWRISKVWVIFLKQIETKYVSYSIDDPRLTIISLFMKNQVAHITSSYYVRSRCLCWNQQIFISHLSFLMDVITSLLSWVPEDALVIIALNNLSLIGRFVLQQKVIV